MKTTPRSQLLLVELICDLVIFAVCAVVCVALLVQARVMSLESTRLTQAVYIAQDAAEAYLSGAAVPEYYTASGGAAQLSDSSARAEYRVEVQLLGRGAEVCVFRISAEEPVYTLRVREGAS